jgi:hypothetical protein
VREPVQPIQPELLAAKFERIRNYEQPHLLEEFGKDSKLVSVLWFLQYVSRPENYPGGLSKFAADLIASEHDLIGTKHAQEIGFSAKSYTLRQAIEVLGELPEIVSKNLFGADSWLVEFYVNATPSGDEDRNALLVSTVTPAAIKQVCIEAAQETLAVYFKQLCELPHVGLREYDTAKVDRARRDAGLAATPGDRLAALLHRSKCWHGEDSRYQSACGAPWFFINVADALLRFTEKRKEMVRQDIAETEVTRLIKRWIAKSRRMRESVMIVGNSRFGKTETIRLCAKMDPGTCRLVDTREGNALSDLLREVANSLGLEFSLYTPVRELRERIDYVLRFANLQLIFEESQFLLPESYSRNTAPARLNWVRRAIMDRDIPVVLVCTPQSYSTAKRHFVKKTEFAMEQFDGRILPPVYLPTTLSDEDLLAVGRLHFRGLPDDYFERPVRELAATERNFLSDIKHVAALAFDNAYEKGRKLPTLADIEEALDAVLQKPPPQVRHDTQTDYQISTGGAADEPKAKPQKKAIHSVSANGEMPQMDNETLPDFRRKTRVAVLGT